VYNREQLKDPDLSSGAVDRAANDGSFGLHFSRVSAHFKSFKVTLFAPFPASIQILEPQVADAFTTAGGWMGWMPSLDFRATSLFTFPFFHSSFMSSLCSYSP
jgi:hypothetical protein